MSIVRAISFARNFSMCRSYRQISHLKDEPNASYIYNEGSEPLSTSTLGDVFAKIAHKYPGRIAIRSVYEDLSITYEELLRQADSLGCTLRENGFNKGDRMGIWSHNSSGWIVALVAAARVGLISVFINPLYEPSELSFCLKKTGIKGLVIGSTLKNRHYYNNLRKLLPELDSSEPGRLKSEKYPELSTVISMEKENLNGVLSLDSLISNRSVDKVSMYGSEVKAEDGCMIHFTSGTTGDPKAALDSHIGAVNNMYFSGKRCGFGEGHQIICLQAPLFHALGSVVTCISGLTFGATLVLPSPTYNVTDNVNAILAEKCTVVTGTPTMYVDIVSQIRDKGDLPMQVRLAVAAAAPCSPQFIRDIKKYLKASYVSSLYGMTEATATVFQSLPEDSIDLVAETVGYIHDHVEVKVVDEVGATVPFGTAGELIIRGYNNMICYWNDPEKTAQVLTQDGWLSSGDKFTITPEGYGRVVGRIKDIIVRGGENIAPKEIEDLLNSHPDIIESQVVGVQDDRLGEELCAVVRTRNGASVTLNDIKSYCSGHLAKFKIPRILKTIDNFPKTGSGKIQKFKLRDMIESGRL